MFTNSYKPISDSGVVNAIESLQFGLSKLKQDVYVFAPKFPNYKDKQIRIYRFPSITLPLKVKYPIAIPYSFKISKIIKRIKLDIIHTHHPFNLGVKGAYFARKYNIPLVFTNHTKYEDYSHYAPFNQNLTKKIIRCMHKRYLNLCDCVLAPSTHIKENLLNMGINSRVEVIPNGINFDLIKNSKPTNIRKLYGLKNKKIVLYIGRLAKEKSIPFIIKAFKLLSKKIKNSVLIIGGSGPEEKNLKKLISDLQINDKVLMAGKIPHSETIKYYSAASVFVTASKTETGPLTVIESLACGVPIVALKKSNLQDIIKDGKNGFLTNDSLKNFSNKIEELLVDEQLLKQLSKNAKKTSHKYNIKNTSRKLLSLYKSLL